MTSQGGEARRLMQGVREGRLSRREFMKRAAALGSSASAVGALLAACGTPAASTAVSGGATTVAAAATQVAPTAAAAATSVAPTVNAAATTVAGAGVAPTAAAAATNPAGAATAVATQVAGAVNTPAPASGVAPIGVTNAEVVLGSWGPQDGPAGAYGVIDRTIAAYFKRVSDEGGVAGRKIRFVYENDSYQPAKTVAAVKKLVEEDKVFALVAGLGTAHNLQVEQYLVQNNVPHVAPATGSSLMSKPLKKNIFVVQTNYVVEASLLARYALDTLKSQKFAVFYQNDQFGKEGLDAINAELKKRSLPEAASTSYETADKNFSAQALRLQTSGADTVIIWAVPQPGGGIIQEMTKIGFKPKLLASAVINDPAIFGIAGPGIEGLVTTAWLPEFSDTSNPKVAAYQDFMKRFASDLPIGGFTQVGYTYAELTTEALKRTGPELTRERFIQTLEALDYTGGMAPRISFSPDNHQGANAVFFQQAKGGKFEKISDFVEYKP